MFPSAYKSGAGYRVKSADLGLNFEEDLSLNPFGIKYFGDADQGHPQEGRRTPVGLIAEFITGGDKSRAANMLASTLNHPVSEFDTINPEPIGLDANPRAAILPGARASAPRPIEFRSMAALMARELTERKWIIPKVLPVGTVLLQARPKMRKTWLAIQLGMAVCTGRPFLDWRCNQGDILFLGLEDSERRLKERISLLKQHDVLYPDLVGFEYFTGGMEISPTTGRMYVSNPEEAERTYAVFPQGKDGVETLNRALDTRPNTKFIVIDTYAHFRGASVDRDIYQRDVDQMYLITRMANQREVCILVVHHEKKGADDSVDFIEHSSGTSGITGSVDAIMSIKGKRGMQEQNEERQLLLTGRDISHEFCIDMAFDAQRGGWMTAARQDVRMAILRLLERSPVMGLMDFVSLLPTVSRTRISQALTTMKFEGLIVQGRVGYSLPNHFKGDFN